MTALEVAGLLMGADINKGHPLIGKVVTSSRAPGVLFEVRNWIPDMSMFELLTVERIEDGSRNVGTMTGMEWDHESERFVYRPRFEDVKTRAMAVAFEHEVTPV